MVTAGVGDAATDLGCAIADGALPATRALSVVTAIGAAVVTGTPLWDSCGVDDSSTVPWLPGDALCTTAWRTEEGDD